MKIINRFVLLIISLVFMFGSLLLAVYSLGIVQSQSLPDIIESLHGEILVGFLFLLAFLAGAWAIYPFFIDDKKGQKTSIKDSELGKVDITLDALKNLVQGIAIQQDGVEEVQTQLEPAENGVYIFLTGKVTPSAVIPEVTGDLQQIVKSYIEDTTGVNVKGVRVLIDNVYEKKVEKEEKDIEKSGIN